MKINLASGKSKSVYLKSRSNDPGNVEVALRQPIGPPDGWKSKFFTKGGANITPDVQEPDGYEFTAAPDKAKKFEMKIKRGGSASNSICVEARLEQPGGGESILTVGVNRALATCI